MRIMRTLMKKPVSEMITDRYDIPPLPALHHPGASSPFRKTLAIRLVDCGSDNAELVEIAALTSPYYDVEQYGIFFVASPRHADLLMVTGAVTRNMAFALKKTYHATPNPKRVMAVGDDACYGGKFTDSYAIAGPVRACIPVDIEVPGNPPEPLTIIRALLALMRS